jgi:predicted RNA-binding protein YlqC (UPF0109 family)
MAHFFGVPNRPITSPLLAGVARRPGQVAAGVCPQTPGTTVRRSGASASVEDRVPGALGTDTLVEGKPMKELIEQIAKTIVENPEEVQVRAIEGEHAVVIELRVAPGDIGKVIGKQGRTITAMRTILNAARAQKEKRQILEVIE